MEAPPQRPDLVCHVKGRPPRSGQPPGECGGPLCVTRRPHPTEKRPDGRPVYRPMVVCTRCGGEVPSHPLLKDAACAALPQDSTPIPPQDYPATVPDRVRVLERKLAERDDALRALEDRLAALEAPRAPISEAGEVHRPDAEESPQRRARPKRDG